jgi:hypothetical protein
MRHGADIKLHRILCNVNMKRMEISPKFNSIIMELHFVKEINCRNSSSFCHLLIL